MGEDNVKKAKEECAAKKEAKKKRSEIEDIMDTSLSDVSAAQNLLEEMNKSGQLCVQDRLLVKKMESSTAVLSREMIVLLMETKLMGVIPADTREHVERGKRILDRMRGHARDFVDKDAAEVAKEYVGGFERVFDVLDNKILAMCETCEETDCPAHPSKHKKSEEPTEEKPVEEKPTPQESEAKPE